MQNLTESEFEDLSAWLDGELPADRAADVAERVRSDPAWRRAHEELAALDEALTACGAPAAPGDLAERIIRRTRRERARRPWRVARWLAPIAAVAAAAVIALFVRAHRTPQPPAPLSGSEVVDAQLKDVPKADRFVVEHLDFFADYPVLVNLETIEAIDRQDAGA